MMQTKVCATFASLFKEAMGEVGYIVMSPEIFSLDP
jgi:hypothetical protein